MALELNGTTGVSLVQNGVVTADDLAAGAARANFGAGAVLQVVTATNTTRATTTSTSFVDTNLSCSITPSSASSKIFAVVSSNINNNNTAGHTALYSLKRGSTDLGGASSEGFGNASGISNIRVEVPCVIAVLDSPATTSSITYTVQFRTSNSAADIEMPSRANAKETLTLMEIAA